MSKPLSDAAQRIIICVLAAALIAAGLYLAWGGLGGGGEDKSAEKQGAAGRPEPIPTDSLDEMRVFDWLPFDEAEIKMAASSAQEFATAYGTVDYRKSREEYFENLRSRADKEYSKALNENSGGGALWEERAKEKTVSTGRANVKSIRGFDDESITFIVQLQSIIESSGGEKDDMDEFAITVVRDGADWRIYDFQPADAANLGDGR